MNRIRTVGIFSALSLIFIFLFACNKQALERIDFSEQRDYMPLKTGFYQIYSVKQTVYRINEQPQSLDYQLKEVVQEKIITEGGFDAYLLYRYKRQNSLQNWALDSVFEARSENDRVVKNEHNIEFIKLSFPLLKGKKWNGNLYNTLGEQSYTVEYEGDTFTSGNVKFENTVKIIAQNDSSKIDKKVLFEVYAAGKGLVYKKHEYLLYCNPDNPEQSDCFGKKIIESGIISEVILLENGQE
jgi:hypothetical protein